MTYQPPRRHRWLSVLVALLLPTFLLLTSVRLLLTPAFLEFEYRTPGFPPDPYGFSRADRLRLSRLALEYLLENHPISFLGDQTFPDGRPLYNERELKHMEDVQRVVRGALWTWRLSGLALLLLALFALLRGGSWAFGTGLRWGVVLTWVGVGLLAVAVLAAFGPFFVFFHSLFFEPGTWIFFADDTLIRLFPERFWRIAFLAAGALTALQSGILWILGGGLRRR